jgi:hypothetical protein
MFEKLVSALSDALARKASLNRQRRRNNRTILRLMELEPRVLLDTNSISPQGIIATDLESHDGKVTLDGNDIRIGVVGVAG